MSSAFNIPAGFALVSLELLDRFPEINPSNYDHDDACKLNAWGVELVLSVSTPPVDAVPGEPVARDWELTCDECAGAGKVDVSEALHVDGRYMGDQLLRETCNACTGYGFTICVADIPKEIQQ